MTPTAIANQTPAAQLPPPDNTAQPNLADQQVIFLRYLPISPELYQQTQLYAAQFPHNVRQMQCDALKALGITVAENQRPLTAWVLAMARDNGLPEVTPQHDIGGAAAELCPRWLYFLA